MCSGYFLGRIANYYEVPRKKIGFWIAVAGWIACANYALEWHNEIGKVWQDHPGIALGLTFAVFMTMWMTLIAMFRLKLKNS
jgi:hypothetical protein